MSLQGGGITRSVKKEKSKYEILISKKREETYLSPSNNNNEIVSMGIAKFFKLMESVVY
jgi:hypothetical protein